MSLSVNIEKRLGEFTLRARFETGDGTMALLGASGSGKSVTLKCIAGILTPDRGRIVLDGDVLFDSALRIDLPPQQRRVGYLFQQYALFPTMSVEKNVRCALHARDKAERAERAEELLRRFRLTGLEKKYPAQLSGGEQQRAALARIMASDPRAILLDEPFAALDSYLKWDLEQELFALLEPFGGPMVWVSHDLGECRRNCAEVCVMENGATGAVMPLDELLRHPATIGAARLAGCRTFIGAQRCEGGLRLDGWDIALPLRAAGGTVAVPDEAVRIGAGEHRAVISRVIHDLDGELILLRPEGADAPPLRALLPRGSTAAAGQRVAFALDTARCWVYE